MDLITAVIGGVFTIHRKFGSDYFDELLERIRDIYDSGKRFYQEIKDIYILSIDYASNLEFIKNFLLQFKKLHFSVYGYIAAELISEKLDASKDNIGLVNFEGRVSNT